MRLRGRLLLACGYVVLLAVVSLSIPLGLNLRDRVDAEVRSSASSQADVVSATATDLLGRRDRRELQRLVETAARSLRGRVIIVNARGTLLADSAGEDTRGRSYASRPEIRAALR